jgi:enoyl-CoA hydratase/carnithine racemase
VSERDVVQYEVQARVARVVLNDPDSRNSLSDELVPPLCEALKSADAREDVAVILLTATGDSFCAGGNIKEFLTFADRPAVTLLEEARRGTGALFHVMADLKTPVVGAVNGPALGGGCGLACACSYVIASDTARFGTTEIRLGLFPLVILPAVRRTVGERRTTEMALTGQIYDATQAAEMGIVDRVVPAADLLAEAESFCAQIAKQSPLAIRLGAAALRETAHMQEHEAIDYLSALRVAFFQSEDLHEGALAFIERRQPNWTGR